MPIRRLQPNMVVRVVECVCGGGGHIFVCKGSCVRDGHDKGRLIEAPVHEAERQDEASSVRFLQILHHSLIELPPIRQGVPYTPLAAVLGVVASEQ